MFKDLKHNKNKYEYEEVKFMKDYLLYCYKSFKLLIENL